MLKFRKNLGVKALCIMLVSVMCFGLFELEVFAGTADWFLFCAPGLLPNEMITSWHGEAVTVSSVTAVQVEKVGGGAEINASTSNGIANTFKSRGYSDVSTARGKTIYMEVHYKNRGTSANRPQGYFIY